MATASMRFCANCANILYPKEDKESKQLMYNCRKCDYIEQSTTGLIYRHEVLHSLSERTAIISDVTADPTLPRTKDVPCPMCENKEAVFFQSTSRSDAEAMTLYFVCTSCSFRFREEDAFAK